MSASLFVSKPRRSRSAFERTPLLRMRKASFTQPKESLTSNHDNEKLLRSAELRCLRGQ